MDTLLKFENTYKTQKLLKYIFNQMKNKLSFVGEGTLQPNPCGKCTCPVYSSNLLSFEYFYR